MNSEAQLENKSSNFITGGAERTFTITHSGQLCKLPYPIPQQNLTLSKDGDVIPISEDRKSVV